MKLIILIITSNDTVKLQYMKQHLLTTYAKKKCYQNPTDSTLTSHILAFFQNNVCLLLDLSEIVTNGLFGVTSSTVSTFFFHGFHWLSEVQVKIKSIVKWLWLLPSLCTFNFKKSCPRWNNILRIMACSECVTTAQVWDSWLSLE